MNLELQEFKNPQTGNIAQVLIDSGGCCTYYEECCAHSVVKAGVNEEEMYWATWTLDDSVISVKVNDHNCLDDALSALEDEIKKSIKPMPWRSETTGM
jgi:hypothetical protein